MINKSEQFKIQPIHQHQWIPTSICCSGRSLYGMQPVVFRLTPQSIESSILITTNPCRSADLKNPRCSYQISCIWRSSSTHVVILRRWQKPWNIFVTETFVIVFRNYYLSKSFTRFIPLTCHVVQPA